MPSFTYDSVIYVGQGVRVTGHRDITIDVIPHYYDAEGSEVFPPQGFVQSGPVTVPLEEQGAGSYSQVQGD